MSAANAAKKRPLRIESVRSKRGRLSLQIVNREGEVVLSGFGYFYEGILRTIVAAVNGCKASDQRLAMTVLEPTEYAKESARGAK